MQHWYIFYFVITFSVCFLMSGLTAVLYQKTKHTLWLYFLAFYAASTLSFGANGLLWYIHANVPNVHTYLMESLDYFEGFICRYLVLATIVVLAHHLLAVSHERLRSALWGAILLFTYIQGHFFEYVINDHDGPFERFADIFEDVVTVILLVYIVITGLYALKRLQHPTQKRLTLKLTILIGCFLPGFVNDTLLSDLSEIRFGPVFYWIFSGVLVHHIVTSAWPPSRERQSLPSGPVASEMLEYTALFEQYAISEREQEVIAMIVQGSSNQHIADTLYISLNTVKTHIRNIYQKLGIQRRRDLFILLKHTSSSTPEPSDKNHPSRASD